MDILWLWVISTGVGVAIGVMPSLLYVLAKRILKPLRLWPWQYVVIWTDDTKTRVKTVQRKDLWFSKKP